MGTWQAGGTAACFRSDRKNLYEKICQRLLDSNDILHRLKDELKDLQKRAKIEVEHAGRSAKKRIQAEYDDIPGLCKVAYTTDAAKGKDKNSISIEEKGWSLTLGAYVDVAPVEDDGVDFEERMAEIHRELVSLQAESNELKDTISKNMRGWGYES